MTATSTAVGLVRSLYEAFGRGDIAYILEHVAADCRWVAPGEGIPNAGTYTGPEGAGEFFRKLNKSEQVLGFEPKEFFANGDDVVVLGTEQCKAIATGKGMSTNWAMLFRVRDGKIAYWESFYDTEAYARAHRG
jgi:ketosteroid isomerase-like protein